jgi:serine/threonine protein kinase
VNNKFIIDMEFCPFGHIQRDSSGVINQFVYNSCFLQFAAALRYLHKKNITHRDLKHNNLMVYRRCFSQWKIKLADFGLSVGDLTGTLTKAMGKGCYSPGYTSPEFDNKDPAISWRSFDIYAMGIIMLKL